MKGQNMIHIASIRDLRKYPNTTKYAIVRSLKKPILGVTQLPVLSPSKSLFWSYCDWKKAGIWNKKTFDELYAPTFLAEIAQSDAQAALDDLARRSHTEDIVLVCFCADVTLCHRSLVAKLLAERGAEMGDII